MNYNRYSALLHKCFSFNLNLSRKLVSSTSIMQKRQRLKCADYLPAKKVYNIQEQKFKYFLVLDFEATCFERHKWRRTHEESFKEGPEHQEIIEFPAILLNPQTMAIEGEFQSFVKPVINPELSSFCIRLTGITQPDVAASPEFGEVLREFNAWFDRIVGQSSCLPITCGDWDLLTMLPTQCTRENLPVPPALQHWHNIKLSYHQVTGCYEKLLMTMLQGLSLEAVGRPHRGIDDCRNITNIVVELLRRGYVFGSTRRLQAAARSAM